MLKLRLKIPLRAGVKLTLISSKRKIGMLRLHSMSSQHFKKGMRPTMKMKLKVTSKLKR